jgi:hypothetical protein
MQQEELCEALAVFIHLQVIAQVVSQVSIWHSIMIFPLIKPKECKKIGSPLFLFGLVICVNALLSELSYRD